LVKIIGKLAPGRPGYNAAINQRETSETKRLERTVKRLARDSCSFFYSANNECYLGGQCSYYRDGFLGYKRCNFLEAAVMDDQKLRDNYFSIIAGERLKRRELKKCERCTSDFEPNSNRAKYCETCRELSRRDRQRKYMQNNRV
jgi:hypothetical protein